MSPRYRDPIDAPIFSLSETDHASQRGFFEGTFISGSPGAGKSSCSGRQIAHAFLRAQSMGGLPMGGLVLTAKAEETTNWIAYAKACGREKDLIIFNAESGHCFDPLHYEWNRSGPGAHDLENIIDFFTTLVAMGQQEGGHSHDPFGKGAMSN